MTEAPSAYGIYNSRSEEGALALLIAGRAFLSPLRGLSFAALPRPDALSPLPAASMPCGLLCPRTQA